MQSLTKEPVDKAAAQPAAVSEAAPKEEPEGKQICASADSYRYLVFDTEVVLLRTLTKPRTNTTF